MFFLNPPCYHQINVMCQPIIWMMLPPATVHYIPQRWFTFNSIVFSMTDKKVIKNNLCAIVCRISVFTTFFLEVKKPQLKHQQLKPTTKKYQATPNATFFSKSVPCCFYFFMKVRTLVRNLIFHTKCLWVLNTFAMIRNICIKEQGERASWIWYCSFVAVE